MERVISSRTNSWRSLKLSQIWSSRTLVFYLMKTDFLVTYKQTVLGIVWSILKPLAMSIAIVFVFNKVGKFPDYNEPYILIAVSALIIWEFFSSAITKGSISLVDVRGYITRINFPRIAIPISSALSNLIGLMINLIVIFVLLIYYQKPLTINIVFIPLVLLLTFTANMSIILILSTINVFYRDIKNMVPFILRLGLFVSPVGFTLQTIPEQWRLLYSLNPMVSIIELMRFCILGQKFLPEFKYILTSSISLFFLFVIGLVLFSRYERKFADVI